MLKLQLYLVWDTNGFWLYYRRLEKDRKAHSTKLKKAKQKINPEIERAEKPYRNILRVKKSLTLLKHQHRRYELKITRT
jgi:hypothetical protein